MNNIDIEGREQEILRSSYLALTKNLVANMEHPHIRFADDGAEYMCAVSELLSFLTDKFGMVIWYSEPITPEQRTLLTQVLSCELPETCLHQYYVDSMEHTPNAVPLLTLIPNWGQCPQLM